MDPECDFDGIRNVGIRDGHLPAVAHQRSSPVTEATKFPQSKGEYHLALRDWVEKGAASEFAMDAEKAVSRSRPRNEAGLKND